MSARSQRKQVRKEEKQQSWQNLTVITRPEGVADQTFSELGFNADEGGLTITDSRPEEAKAVVIC